MSSYLLDNAAPEACARLNALAELYDPGTIRHLDACGVSVGWRCLEIGGGGGSIARWLADRVGSEGRVVVTDLDTRHLEALADPRLEVRRHDAATPLPEGPFELIHARLVINHLRERDAILRRMVAALAPGGWLLVEDFDSESAPPDPDADAGETYLTTHRALARLMADRGFDRRYGRRLFRRFQDCDLTEVSAEARMFMCRGGSPGTRLIGANLAQLRDALIDGGYVTAKVFDEDVAALSRPGFLMPSSILWSVRGRRAPL
jgi:SAM-dependent methyltransferase